MSEVEEPVICTACSAGPCAKTYLTRSQCEHYNNAPQSVAEPDAAPAPEEEV